jgi:hypothetical protein
MSIEMACEAQRGLDHHLKQRDYQVYRPAVLIEPDRNESADTTGLPLRNDS